MHVPQLHPGQLLRKKGGGRRDRRGGGDDGGDGDETAGDDGDVADGDAAAPPFSSAAEGGDDPRRGGGGSISGTITFSNPAAAIMRLRSSFGWCVADLVEQSSLSLPRTASCVTCHISELEFYCQAAFQS